MADFYFFTDIDLLNSQNGSEAFGPAGVSSGYEQYRVTSMHTATGTPKAYAICDGTVCIQQDQGNSSLINLILKPSQKLEINFSSIKYIIYKGIMKSSLLDGSGNVVVNPNNDLTASIKISWDLFLLATGASSTPAPENSLGIDINSSTTNFSDTDIIDNLFYREGVSYQFPNVKGKSVIGDFDPTGFGLDIITESIGYEPKLILTRTKENFVKVQQLTGTPTAAQTFQFNHDKEEILNFVDPCAFYGSFYSEKIQAKTSTGVFDKVSGNDLYDKVIKGVQHTLAANGNFFNRNIIYLDIRNEQNQSFNYYKNYSDNINISLNGSTVANSNYYVSGWPLLILNSTGAPAFPTGNTSDKNTISINLPKGDNEIPLAYISQGYKNKIFPFAKQLKGKSKFIELTLPTNYTSDIELATPNRDSNSDTTVVSCIIKIRYFKKINRRTGVPPASSGTVLRSTDFFDSLFPLFKMRIPFPFSSGVPKVRVKVYHEEVYVDWLNEGRTDFVADIGIAEDANSISLFAFAKDINKSKNVFRTHDKISINSEASNVANFFLNYIDDAEKLNKLAETNLTINTLSPPAVQVVKFESDNPSFLEKFTLPDYENQFICVVLDKANFTAIQANSQSATLGNISNNYKAFLGIANRNDRDVPTSNDQSDDSPPFKYYSYDVVIKGFSIDGAGNIAAVEYTPLDTSSNPFKIYN